MKISYLKSSDFPKVHNAIARNINFGLYQLFTSSTLGEGYFVTNNIDLWHYSLEFELLNKLERSGLELGITEIFYFSDIERPPSLSEQKMNKCCDRR